MIDYIDYTPDLIPPVAVTTQKPWVRSEDLWPGFRAWRAWHPVGGEFVTNGWHRALRFALGDATVGV